jgi:hypothetical protein
MILENYFIFIAVITFEYFDCFRMIFTVESLDFFLDLNFFEHLIFFRFEDRKFEYCISLIYFLAIKLIFNYLRSCSTVKSVFILLFSFMFLAFNFNFTPILT